MADGGVSQRRTGFAAWSVIAALALAATRAGADSWSASVEPVFGHGETETRDQAGTTTSRTSDEFIQRYNLSLERAFTSQLSAAAGGTLADQRSWIRPGGGSTVYDRALSNTSFGRLSVNSAVLGGGIGVDRSQQAARIGAGADLVTTNYSSFLSWRPLNLPELDLRVARSNSYDEDRRSRDTTADGASLAARFRADRYELRYLLGWGRTTDRLRDSKSTSVDQALTATRNDLLFDRRVTSYASATVQTQNGFFEASSTTATSARQQLPVGGLSGIEALPATALQGALTPNATLVDGNTAAGAAVNVGFGPATLGDRDPRDVGARFADVVTPVNTLYVWLDRAPAGAVGTALAGTARVYRSDNNLDWTEVTPAATSPSPFDNRLEVTIPRTQARFLKVALQPLGIGVTGDANYRDLQVTEVQFFLILPATEVPRRTATVSASATGTLRTVILRGPDVTHDLQVSVARTTALDHTRYNLVNGLGALHEFSPRLMVNARVARTDQDDGVGHEGRWEWSASAVGRPLPVAYWSANYNGSARGPTRMLHAWSLLGRADLYDGISAQGSGGISVSKHLTRSTQSAQTSGSLSLAPNRVITLTGGWTYTRTRTVEALDGSAVLTQSARLDAGLALSPAPAVAVTGTVSRVLFGTRPTTLGALQVNYSPLRGDLQLSAAYSNTLDTAAETTTEVFGPTLRWNLRRGVALTGSYTYLKSDAPAQRFVSRTVFASLLLTL